jgi:hypothetical protein
MNEHAGKTSAPSSRAVANNFAQKKNVFENQVPVLQLMKPFGQEGGEDEEQRPSEKFADMNNSETDEDFALIGTDYNLPGANLIVEALGIFNRENNGLLPAYLSKYLKGLEDKKFSDAKNINWLEETSAKFPVFIVRHKEIERTAVEGTSDDALKKLKSNPKYIKKGRKGTWMEVETLLGKGYTWYKNLLFPPNLSAERVAQLEVKANKWLVDSEKAQALNKKSGFAKNNSSSSSSSSSSSAVGPRPDRLNLEQNLTKKGKGVQGPVNKASLSFPPSNLPAASPTSNNQSPAPNPNVFTGDDDEAPQTYGPAAPPKNLKPPPGFPALPNLSSPTKPFSASVSSSSSFQPSSLPAASPTSNYQSSATNPNVFPRDNDEAPPAYVPAATPKNLRPPPGFHALPNLSSPTKPFSASVSSSSSFQPSSLPAANPTSGYPPQAVEQINQAAPQFEQKKDVEED